MKRSVRINSILTFIQLTLAPALFAATNVTTDITANTRWTIDGSPYVLSKDITVATGATLTIDPGVVVKFGNYVGRSLIVSGQLQSLGTADQHVVFTSLADDRFGGDTGGDGPTTGAPGQWYMIRLNGAQSTLSYTDVFFGGWGSSDQVYGMVSIGSMANHVLDHTTIDHSQHAGVVIGGSATISNSTISSNAVGLSIMNGAVDLSSSVITGSSSIGVWFNNTVAYTGPRSTLVGNTISYNKSTGVRLQIDSSTPTALLPVGHENNIVGNDYASTSPKQLNGTKLPTADWTNNYWAKSTSTGLIGVSVQACGKAPAGSWPYHLSYNDQTSQSLPDGPIPATFYIVTNNPVKFCGSDGLMSTPPSLLPF